jgi:hypothetical protein
MCTQLEHEFPFSYFRFEVYWLLQRTLLSKGKVVFHLTTYYIMKTYGGVPINLDIRWR